MNQPDPMDGVDCVSFVYTRQDPDPAVVTLPPGAMVEGWWQDPTNGRYYVRALLPIAPAGTLITHETHEGEARTLQVGSAGEQ